MNFVFESFPFAPHFLWEYKELGGSSVCTGLCHNGENSWKLQCFKAATGWLAQPCHMEKYIFIILDCSKMTPVSQREIVSLINGCFSYKYLWKRSPDKIAHKTCRNGRNLGRTTLPTISGKHNLYFFVKVQGSLTTYVESLKLDFLVYDCILIPH